MVGKEIMEINVLSFTDLFLLCCVEYQLQKKNMQLKNSSVSLMK